MAQEITIHLADLSDGKPRYHAGKPKGESARKHFNLDELDKTNDMVINVVVPDWFDCNESYLDGLFSRSVVNLKSETDFLSKYKFVGSPNYFKEILFEMIGTALREKSPFGDL